MTLFITIVVSVSSSVCSVSVFSKFKMSIPDTSRLSKNQKTPQCYHNTIPSGVVSGNFRDNS